MCKLKHFLKIIRLRRFPSNIVEVYEWPLTRICLCFERYVDWNKDVLCDQNQDTCTWEEDFWKTLVRTAELFSSGCFCFWISKAPHATLLEKRPWHRCFPVNFAKFLRTPFFTEHLWWVLLGFISWNTFNNQICIKSTYQELKMR